jgi:hypothetical protein
VRTIRWDRFFQSLIFTCLKFAAEFQSYMLLMFLTNFGITFKKIKCSAAFMVAEIALKGNAYIDINQE